MTEIYTAWCPEKLKQVEVEGLIVPVMSVTIYVHPKVETGIVSLHVHRCPKQGTCHRFQKPDCLVDHHLQGKWQTK